MQSPVNKNASSEAKELLNFLCMCAGNSIITGQHTQTIPMEEIQYIRQVTGSSPKLRGFELLSYSPNINYSDASKECITEVQENKNTIQVALEWAKQKGNILTFSFHWFSPIGGHDKSFYTKNTDFDPTRILIDGTPERKAFFHDMDIIAELLKPFKDAYIPILWRPFHESDGTWFWWGSKGPKVAKELYKLMFNHYIDFHHLDNLLWVWNCRQKEGYPGDEYTDIISVDVYLPSYMQTDYKNEYEELIKNTTKNKIAALAEVGYIPDVDILQKSQIPWAYFMSWSKEFIIGEKYNKIENLKKMYNSPYSIKNS